MVGATWRTRDQSRTHRCGWQDARATKKRANGGRRVQLCLVTFVSSRPQRHRGRELARRVQANEKRDINVENHKRPEALLMLTHDGPARGTDINRLPLEEPSDYVLLHPQKGLPRDLKPRVVAQHFLGTRSSRHTAGNYAIQHGVPSQSIVAVDSTQGRREGRGGEGKRRQERGEERKGEDNLEIMEETEQKYRKEQAKNIVKVAWEHAEEVGSIGKRSQHKDSLLAPTRIVLAVDAQIDIPSSVLFSRPSTNRFFRIVFPTISRQVGDRTDLVEEEPQGLQ